MNTVTMYIAKTYSGTKMFFNPGEARDVGDTERYETGVLHFDGDLSALKERAPFYVYRGLRENTTNTDWYLSEKEVYASDPNNTWLLLLEKAQVCEPFLTPVKLPVRTHLYTNTRGLVARLNLHPEVDGSYARGKVYFQDRTCTNKLCDGPAIITAVKDKGTYGFFSAEMVKYEWPTDKELLEHVKANPDMNNCHLTYVETEHFGKIAVASERVTWSAICFPLHKAFGVLNGEMTVIHYPEVLEDPGDDIKGVDIADMLCQEYFQCDFSELTGRFVQLPDRYFKQFRYSESDRYVSDLMDDAVDSGIITPIMLEGSVFCYKLNPTGLLNVLYGFSKEEMKKIIKTFNQVNQEANNKITGLIKRGKLRII